MLPTEFATAKSGFPSPLKSPTAIALGALPVEGDDATGVNVPSPLPRRIVTLLLEVFTTAKSNFQSPLKSPTAIDLGEFPAAMGEPLAFPNVTHGAETIIGNKIVFEIKAVPGLATVIQAVPAESMLAAGTVAVSSALLTNVVSSAAPFQLTVAPEAKPVPLTVRVNSAPPGATLVGTRG
jgi:hypothetical protein